MKKKRGIKWLIDKLKNNNKLRENLRIKNLFVVQNESSAPE